MDDAFIQNALTYAGRHQLRLAERLGFGIHGIIYAAEDKSAGGQTAVKAHRAPEPYHRECTVYQRLLELHVSEIRGFNVPQMLRTDDDLLVIEMTIVTRPFVLDFAGAYLDTPPSFSDEVWAEWEAARREQFDDQWPEVKTVLGILEAWDIHMVDVSPSNIAFRN
ncbi:MAG: hypothetical protein U1F83_14975 [Verrucomicrobiota bacterium]